MNMKKPICILLAFAMFFSGFLGIPKAYAEEPITITISGDKTQYSVGDDIKISVKSSNAADMFGVQFTFKYDTNALQFNESIKVSSNYVLYGIDEKVDAGELAYGIINQSPGTHDGLIGNISFKALKEGDTKLELTKIKAVKSDGSSVREIPVNKGYYIDIKISKKDVPVDPNPNPTPIPEPSEKLIERHKGNDRYETCVSISKAGWEKSDYVVIATGEDFPDALSAAPLAKKYGAPILITRSKDLNPSIEKEIERLNAKHAILVGGNSGISQDIENRLTSKGIECTRLEGKNRYETAAKIADHIGDASEVIIATGDNFPDTLSIASYAAFKNIPILLTQKNNLPDSSANYIKKNNIAKVYAIGGTKVISDSVFKNISNVERISGEDRYETNIEILNKFSKEFDLSSVYIATGQNFPDALTGSILAASSKSPLILVNDNLSKYTAKYVKDNIDKIKSIYILGGEQVIPDSIVKTLIGK